MNGAEKSLAVYDTETRDLMNLARRRQEQAITSVVQLARDPAQAYVIAQATAMSAFAYAAGAYSAWQGTKLDDPLDLAEALIKLMREPSP